MEVGVMKPGDYMIHVYVQVGKNFKPEDSQETADFLLEKGRQVEAKQTLFNALLSVECGSQLKYSKSQEILTNNDNSDYWGEHFFFEPRGLSQDDIQDYKVKLTMLDKGFLRDQKVGEFEFDVAQLYFANDEHAIQHQWIALVNPQAIKSAQVKGYLRVSVAI